MSIGAFGDKTFEVTHERIYTPDGLNYKESLSVEMQETEGGKPATYIKGLGAMEIGFDIQLKHRFCDVQAEIDWWLLKMRSGTPEYLTIGAKTYGTNKQLLKDVSVADKVILADGTVVSAKISLSFSEYTAKGYKKDENSTTETSGNSTTTTKTRTTTKQTTTTNTGKKSEFASNPATVGSLATNMNSVLKKSTSNSTTTSSNSSYISKLGTVGMNKIFINLKVVKK